MSAEVAKDAPSSVIRLARIYNEAFNKLLTKAGGSQFLLDYLSKRQKISSGDESATLTQKDLVALRTVDINEFIAGIFFDENFRELVGNEPFMESGKSIIQAWAETLLKFLQQIYSTFREGSIGRETMDALYEFLTEERKTVPDSFTPVKEEDIFFVTDENKNKDQQTRDFLRLLDEKATPENNHPEIPFEPTSKEKGHGTPNLPIVDTEDITSSEGTKGAAQYDRKNKIIKVNRPLLKQKFREKAWTKMRELVEIIHGEESNIPHFKEYDSEINKGVKGYSQTIVSTGNGYYYVYAKDIELEGFTDMSFKVFKDSNTGKYIIIESTTGRPIVQNEKTIKAASDSALAILNKAGKEQVIKIIGNTPKLGENIVKSKAKDLPENQFETYEQFEAFVIEHEYQHSLYSRQDFDKEFPNKTKGDYESEINRRALAQIALRQKQEAQQPHSEYLDSLNTIELYSKLGNKTESGNVTVVKNIFANKDNKDVITAFRVDKKLGLLESFRKYNAIGNPINWQGFKPRFEGDNATIAFMDWFLGKDYTDVEQEYRQEILNNLDNLKGKTIEYYKELGRPSHATALDYLINEYNWDTQITPQQKQLATKENPIQIYADGSDIKGTGQIGFGVYFEFNGKKFEYSGIANKKDFGDKYNISEQELINAVSNPTMELMAAVEVLEQFKDTAEHIEIINDYEGVKAWITGTWNAKKSYIQDLVTRARNLITQIEKNGGSVKITTLKEHAGVKSHSGHWGNDNADRLAKLREFKNNLNDLYNTDYNTGEITSTSELTSAVVAENLNINKDNVYRTLLKEGKIENQGYTLTLEEFNSMTKEEQDNFIKCL